MMGSMSRTTEPTEFTIPADPGRIRTVVLVGPSGSGKSALYAAMVGGTVVQGRAPEEELSVGLVAASTSYQDTAVTVVDTPGRPDFVGEVRAGLRAADAVVFVVSAADGVDEATRLLWRECEAVGIPRAVAVTQLELTRSDFDAVSADVRRTFGDARPLFVPVMGSGTVDGVVDLLHARTHLTGQPPSDPTPEQQQAIDDRRGPFLESVIEQSEDETLLDRYLEGEEIDADTIEADLRAAVASARFFPIIPVHPPSGAGVEQLLQVIVRGFPSPDRAWMPRVTTPDGGDFGEVTADPDGPLVAEVVSTTTDPYVGRLSLVRVFSGTLRAGESVHVSGHLERVVGHEVEGHPGHDETDERVGQLSTPLADGATAPRDHAVAGEVVQVSKITKAETSDTLSSLARPALIEPWLLPEPLLPVAIKASSPGEEDKLAQALQRVVAEDVTMRLERNPETHQLVIWALGPAHLDAVLATLRDRHHVEVEVEPVRTSLRETFVRKTAVQGRLVKQSGGHGQYAVVQLEIEPLDRGAGFEFVDKVVGGAVPRQFIPSVEKGARHQLQEGVLAGYPCVDVRVTLLDGKAHSVDSSDMAFQTAAALALREAANDSTVSLLEPVDRVEVEVNDDAVGAVLADLRGRRAQVHATVPADTEGRTTVVAEVPQGELARYPIDLRSVSHGSGSFRREFVRYDYLPATLAKDVGRNTR